MGNVNDTMSEVSSVKSLEYVVEDSVSVTGGRVPGLIGVAGTLPN